MRCWRSRETCIAVGSTADGEEAGLAHAGVATVIAQRSVVPELLDSLPVDDPLAIGSRADLRRINRIMGAASLLARALDQLLRGAGTVELVELGAGDGNLLLRVAESRAKDWPQVNLKLLDLQPVVSDITLQRYRKLGWRCEVVRADVFDWLAQDEARSGADDRPIVIANLFLHHFEGQRLAALLSGIATRAHAFVALEPRRARTALLGSRLLGALGCNDVTRHDAVVSVRAGFTDRDLSECWPRDQGWELREHPVGLFSHRLVAVRR